MPLHYDRDGYRFHADAHTLTIEPGPGPITLARPELNQLGLTFVDNYQVPLTSSPRETGTLDEILAALNESLRRCKGAEDTWIGLSLRRVMVLIGGLDEEMARRILDQEGI